MCYPRALEIVGDALSLAASEKRTGPTLSRAMLWTPSVAIFTRFDIGDCISPVRRY